MRKKPALMTLVAGECANHRDGACLGMDIKVDKATGRISYPQSELPRCLVAMRLPCRYFERCIMPAAMKRQEYVGAANEYAHRNSRSIKSVLEGLEDEALRALLVVHPFLGHDKGFGHQPRGTRFCECGERLLKGRQLCERCRKERKRLSVRESMRRKRSARLGVSQS